MTDVHIGGHLDTDVNAQAGTGPSTSQGEGPGAEPSLAPLGRGQACDTLIVGLQVLCYSGPGVVHGRRSPSPLPGVGEKTGIWRLQSEGDFLRGEAWEPQRCPHTWGNGSRPRGSCVSATFTWTLCPCVTISGELSRQPLRHVPWPALRPHAPGCWGSQAGVLLEAPASLLRLVSPGLSGHEGWEGAKEWARKIAETQAVRAHCSSAWNFHSSPQDSCQQGVVRSYLSTWK